MFQYLVAFVLFYAASAADTYGVPKPDYTPDVPSNTYDVPSNTYQQQGYPFPDYYPDNDHHHRGCRKLRRLHISGQPTRHASFSDLERNGDSYVKISCPNNNKPYAIVAEKYGKTVNFDTITLNDKVVLATGYNIDYVVKCRRGRIVGDDINGDLVSIKRVTCLELPAPVPITTL